MITLATDAQGVATLTCDDVTARILSSLINAARPSGAAEYVGIRVVVVCAAPPPEPRPAHSPVEPR